MNNNKQIIERIVKLVNLIGIAGKNNIKNTSFLVLGEPITFNLSLDSNPLNGSSYFYDDYELLIKSDGRALMIKTEAIEHHDNSTYNYGTSITIKCHLKNNSEITFGTYINGWNYNNIASLETSDFKQISINDIIFSLKNSKVVDLDLFFTPSELEEIIDEFNYHICELKKKQQEDEEIVDEALSNLTKNQINILKKKLI